MVVENDSLGRQPVEVRRLDPRIAVGTKKAQVKAVANHDDDIHVSIDSVRCRRGGRAKASDFDERAQGWASFRVEARPIVTHRAPRVSDLRIVRRAHAQHRARVIDCNHGISAETDSGDRNDCLHASSGLICK
jgi:hypothetical protein